MLFRKSSLLALSMFLATTHGTALYASTSQGDVSGRLICTDNDGDGFCAEIDDCDDSDPTTFPGAVEICDGIDNDCDTIVPADELDLDADGFPVCSGDCDDGDPTTFPGAVEICDGIDNDCDTIVPADELDPDVDGLLTCAPDNCPQDYNPSQIDSDLDGTGNVCDPNNICSGIDAIEENTTYSGDVYCAAESSITSGGAEPTPGAVTIDSTGNVVYSAPVVKLIPLFSVEANGVFQVGGDLSAPALCSEACAFSDDGWCDDGGPGSDYALCPLGTDCIDCGPR